jgi:hypothetical protein
MHDRQPGRYAVAFAPHALAKKVEVLVELIEDGFGVLGVTRTQMAAQLGQAEVSDLESLVHDLV